MNITANGVILNDDEPEKESEGGDEQRFDTRLYERLFDQRTVLITGPINDRVARRATAQLLALDAAGGDYINVFISSPGGHVESGDMIFDMIRFVDCPVRTIGTGWVASAGALIFVAAKRENRLCLPNTRFLLHQPSGGMMGDASSIAIQAEQIIKMRERLNQIFADATGQSIERVQKDTDRDYWMTPSEAIDYGLLGRVIGHKSELMR